MSHRHQRKEKNCLNCGAEVAGKYCQNCGQENVVPQESFWHFAVHFVNDITHFDGKFFSTLNVLLFRPGFLSAEYMRGRRESYLNPVRMYLFTSFIFFLIFYSYYHFDERLEKSGKLNPNTEVSAEGVPIFKLDSLDFVSVDSTGEKHIKKENKLKLSPDLKYSSRANYDSLVEAGIVKDGWLKRKIERKKLDIDEKYGDNEGGFLKVFLAKLLHTFPQMLFVSLPVIALILKLLYIRRKQFYYVGHAIFVIHFYIFVFIIMLVNMGISYLADVTHISRLDVINPVLNVVTFFYLYKAMRNFYKQGRGKTVLKYVLFLFAFLFVIIFLFLVFGVFSLFQV